MLKMVCQPQLAVFGQDHSKNTDLCFRLVLKDTPESGEFGGSRLTRERSTDGPKKNKEESCPLTVT